LGRLTGIVSNVKAHDCLFCRIIAGEVPAEKVGETKEILAIKDIAPQAPMHLLVMPKIHVENIGGLAEVSATVLADLISMSRSLALEFGSGDYRLIFNTGPEAGQSVGHVHGHVLGGKQLEWNPA
jgi:histidine triad (HIT) family protein